jgi:hypothetical protein
VVATLDSFELGSPEREEYIKQRKESTAAIREVRMYALLCVAKILTMVTARPTLREVARHSTEPARGRSGSCP